MHFAVEPHELGEQTAGEPFAQQPDQHSELAVQLHHHCCSFAAPVLMQRPRYQSAGRRHEHHSPVSAVLF